MADKEQLDKKQLVSVKTGEPYQPVRIYYQVTKKKTVLSALQKLRCIEFDSAQQRWNWLYEEEAKKLKFTRSYKALLPQDRPLILGYFTFRGDTQMLFDVRSQERAIAALDFFGKRINRYAARPTHLRLVNRYFSAAEMPNRQIHPSLDTFFDGDNVRCIAKEMEAKLHQLETDYADDADAKQKAITDYMNQQMQQRHPEIEELSLEDLPLSGTVGLQMTLLMRQREAFELWNGNFTYNPASLFEEMVSAIAADLREEDLDAADLGEEDLDTVSEGADEEPNAATTT